MIEVKSAFAPHRIPREKLRALKKDVLVSDMEFDTRITQSGLILPNDNGTSLGIRPRWSLKIFPMKRKFVMLFSLPLTQF